MSHGKSVTHHQTREEMPDCDGMGAPGSSMRKCDMGARNTQKVSAVNVGLFVLSSPIGIEQSFVANFDFSGGSAFGICGFANSCYTPSSNFTLLIR